MNFLNPIAVAVLVLLVGTGLAVAGVYLLAGPGWALIAGALPFLVFALVIFRGVRRAQQVPG